MSNTLIITVSIWTIIPLIFIVYNLYTKNSKMENIIISQRLFIRDFLTMSKQFSEIVNKIEMTMWVNSDPEMNEMFEKIKSLKAILDQYEETT